jgi:LPXTG-motif cell wall-anchored protein
MFRTTFVSAVAAFALAAPGAMAAAEEAPVAPEAPAEATAPEPAEEAQAAPAKPAPAPAPAPPARAAQEDTSGANEYSEEGVPTPTEDPAPVEEPSTDAPAASPTPSAPSAAPAAETTTTEPVADTGGLPRTGAESWPIALIGIAALAAGLLLRRREIATQRT